MLAKLVNERVDNFVGQLLGDIDVKVRAGGFSLLELVVAMAIIGILGAIAIPFYQSYLQGGQEAAAKTVLVDVAQKQVQYRIDRRGAYCCTGVTNDAAGALDMLTGLNISMPQDVTKVYTAIAWYQAFQETPTYSPAEFAFCLEPNAAAVPGTRALRIDQSGRRTSGVDCSSSPGGASHAGAKSW